jgi:hypothetical protein
MRRALKRATPHPAKLRLATFPRKGGKGSAPYFAESAARARATRAAAAVGA